MRTKLPFSIFIILLMPISLLCQDFAVRSMPYFSTTRGYENEYYVTGTIIGFDYAIRQDQVINKYLEVDFEYANMKSAQVSSSVYMYSIISGYKLMTDYNFFTSFRLRYSYASRPVSFGDSSINGAYPINYTDKTNALKYHCVGAELLFGKRFFFINEGRLYLDLGVGGGYNHTLVTNMDIMYKTDELPAFWTKIILQLGYKF